MSSGGAAAAASSLSTVASHVSSAGGHSNASQAMPALQLDAGLVDSYLLRLLLPRLVSMTKHFPDLGIPSDLMATLLHVATLWFTSLQTPAIKALGMNVRGNGHEERRDNGVTRYTTWKLILLSVVIPKAYQQIVSWHERSSRSTAADRMTQIAFERKRKVARALICAVQRVIPILRLAALLSCWSGRSNAPGLATCLAGLTFVQDEAQQQPPVNVTYAHRRWLYEELLSTLKSISPYSSASFSSLNSWLLDWIPSLWKLRQNNADNRSRCPICGSKPISIPYITNCDHVYCYPCLWNAALDSPRFRCKECSQVVCSSRPLESSPRRQNRKLGTH